jgi:hypothetical protein
MCGGGEYNEIKNSNLTGEQYIEQGFARKSYGFVQNHQGYDIFVCTAVNFAVEGDSRILVHLVGDEKVIQMLINRSGCFFFKTLAPCSS